jgi:hypothetical protein
MKVEVKHKTGIELLGTNLNILYFARIGTYRRAVMFKKILQGFLTAGLAFWVGAAPGGAAGIKLTESEEDGVKLYRMENDYYDTTFVPAQAMFPLYFKYKPTGNDILVRRADLATSFRYRDGIQLCLPCVGGVPDRLAYKGYLDSTDWETTTSIKDGQGILTSRATIDYNDPVSGTPARLTITVTVIGTERSRRLQMDFMIKNIGAQSARFMFFAHANVAPEGIYKEGDYIYTPAKRCWISEFQWPALANAGVTPHSWTAWPVPGVDTFAPKTPEEKRGDYAYAFIPANWLVVGNEHTENFVVFQSSEIKIGNRFQPSPYYCVLRRDHDYLVEVGVSHELAAKYWEIPGAVTVLEPDETLAYSLHMAAGQGLSRSEARNIISVQPDRVVCQPEKGGAAKVIRLED